MTPLPTARSGTPKAIKRSVLGWLFNPQLGPAISPLRESTRIFLQLMATVFASYMLIPKDYPGLHDSNTRLTLSGIIGTAWRNLRFTRESLPQTILFFAITGMMAFSAVVAVFSLLSLFVGHAHAATNGAGGGSLFTPGAEDVAQSWLNYLFIGPSGGANSSYPTLSDTYGDATATMPDPFQGSVALQGALMTALAMYSDAILIVAAIILFYHLAAMVVETAHHGVPMGKRASQIWAPIRLVVAIGLLVPINGGLNSGQFIVIKMAELGSALASNVWGVFLTQLASYNTTATSPAAALQQQVAIAIIRMEACKISWNYHTTLAGLSAAIMTPTTSTSPAGTTTHYSGNSGADQDICGSYFIASSSGSSSPNSGNFANALEQAAAQAQTQAIQSSMSAFDTAAQEINNVLPPVPGTPISSSIPLDSSFQDAIGTYQQNVDQGIANSISNSQVGNQISAAVNTMKPYGWVMAGAFLNTISRIQADIADAASSSMPKTTPPKPDSQAPELNLTGASDPDGANIPLLVATDLANFDTLQYAAINNAPSTTNVGCSAMVGLDVGPKDGDGLVGFMFKVIERIAESYNVWTEDDQSNVCDSSTPNPGAKGFTLGVQVNGNDPIAQMSLLGHNFIRAAMQLVGYGVAIQAGSGLLEGLDSGTQSVLKARIDGSSSSLKKLLGGLSGAGGMVGAAGSAIGSLMMFIALIFWTAGFVLAFLLPVMPFMRFFFAVIAWVAAIVEAIIAIPLVALAHLSPEGEGLSGEKAKAAYFFVFNLFVRPVLVVFGLICGLIMFMIALSFLNYGYAIAVAGAGATASGYATLSRLIYSILYVGVLYVTSNHCFMLIDHLPEQALRWMGAQGQAIPKMGDAERIENIGTVISGYAGQQAMGQLSSNAEKIGKSVGSGAKEIAANLFGSGPPGEVPPKTPPTTIKPGV